MARTGASATPGADRVVKALGTGKIDPLWLDSTIVDLSTSQAITAAKSFSGGLSTKAGTSATFAKVGGSIFYSTTAVGNVGAGEDDLLTTSLPANLLAVNGDSVRVFAAGSFATSVNSKRLRIRYGSTLLFDSTALSISLAADWVAYVEIVRTGATAQLASVSLTTGSTVLLASAAVVTAAETLSGAVTLKITGEATSDNDVQAKMWKGTWSSAP